MSIFSDLYGIQESTLYDKSDLLHFPLSEPLKKYFNLEITNLAKEILDANCVIIWNFDDPFSNENEFRTSDLLEIVDHTFKYAGIYNISVFINVNDYRFITYSRVLVNESYSWLEATPIGGIYYENQLISLKSLDTKATIYYTLDDSNPQYSETRIQYIGPFEISENTKVRYYAINEDLIITPEYQDVYTLQFINPNIPIYPTDTNLLEPTYISFDYDPNEIDVWYSINSGDPILYTEPFLIDVTCSIRYYGVNKLGIKYLDNIKYYFVDLVQPQVTILPQELLVYNNLIITLVPNKNNLIINYSVSGLSLTPYTQPIDIIDIFDFEDETNIQYNIPLYVSVEDVYGRKTEYNINYNFIIDKNPPIITYVQTPPSPTTTRTALFKFTVNEDIDLDIKEATVDIKLNNDNYEEYGICVAGTIYQYYVFDLLPGIQSLYFKLTDKAGNITENIFTWEVQ